MRSADERAEGLRRRDALGGLAAATVLATGVRAAVAGRGDAMLADVQAYDALGEHRTATSVDDATSRWLAHKLAAAGLTASLQAFPAPLFTPRTCEVRLGADRIACFPAWPVKPSVGVSGPLAPHDAPSLTGKIALIRLPFKAGGSWAAPGFGDLVMQTAALGPLGIVAITDGPTGGVIALNAVPSRLIWPVPVVIAPGRDGDRLAAAAAAGQSAVLVNAGDASPGAVATNVVARRPGRGKTIVVSTPKSGWFHCAGERGTGIAVFLALARDLVKGSDADLLFVAFSGHELDEMGGGYFLGHGTPTPDRTRIWLHVGANAAMQDLAVQGASVVPQPRPGPDRRVTVTAPAQAAAAQAFTAQAGYGAPMLMNAVNAVGELSIFFGAGYGAIAGLAGANPLFHTQLDRADVATTPAILDAVRGSASSFLRVFAAD